MTSSPSRLASLSRDLAAILSALALAHGNQAAAARAIGMPLATLKRRLARAGHTAASLRDLYPLAGRQPPHPKNKPAAPP